MGAFEDARSMARKVNQYFQLGPAGYIWLGIVALAVTIAVIAVVTELRRRRRIRQVLHAGKDVPLKKTPRGGVLSRSSRRTRSGRLRQAGIDPTIETPGRGAPHPP